MLVLLKVYVNVNKGLLNELYNKLEINREKRTFNNFLWKLQRTGLSEYVCRFQ